MSAAAETALDRELAEVESAIADVDALLDTVFEHSPHGICIGRLDGTLKVNSAGAKILGSVQDARGSDAWSQQYGLFLEDGQTPHPPQTLPLVRALGGETVRGATLRMRSQARPEGAWLEVEARPLADGSAVAVFRDVTREREARANLAARNEELLARDRENRELTERLRVSLDALSTPLLEVGPGILAVPVIGVLDTQRGVAMTEKILAEVRRSKATHVVIDLTGVAIIDTSTADHLLKLGAALQLLGTECVVSGIQPAVAQTLVAIGVEIAAIVARRDLQHAIEYCRSARGETDA